jgi:transposase
MPGKAAKVMLTEEQERILQRICRTTTQPQRLIQRARIILMAFAGSHNVDIAATVGLARKQVGLWRRRWQQSYEALVAIECRETSAKLCRAVKEVLSDAPRRGSPGTFTAEQVTQIIAIACEPPEQSGRPVDRWTHRELAEEVMHRGIVSSISPSQVGRYLLEAELQPHRRKYWLNAKEKDPGVSRRRLT